MRFGYLHARYRAEVTRSNFGKLGGNANSFK
jgi:hypothetical protein